MTAEQQARDMLERMEIDGAQNFSAGEIVELANLISECNRLKSAIDYISTADTGGEIYPSGPADIEYAPDGNTVLRYIGPWYFKKGSGDSFLEAVEDAMKKP